MYLERLEIFGFKSFGKKTILIFPPGITCIVGPNGCGKSNIIDAIRWILGEQSFKNLRVDKVDDLIFSSDKKRLNFCHGLILLKNEENNLKIERKLFRDGGNEYFLNDNKIKREDLILALAKINFGPKGYSIIGQGLVDWIFYSSKEERKEFFDEATGVKEYQIKKEKAEAKIKKSLINLSQAEIALSEVEPRVRSLTRQIKKWQKRKEIEEKLINLEKEYYGGKLFRLKKEIEKIVYKIEEKRSILKKEEEELKKFQEEMKKLAVVESSKEFKDLEKDWRNYLEKRNELILIKEKLKRDLSFEKKEIGEKELKEIEEMLKELSFQQEKLIEEINSFREDKILEIKKIAEEILKKIKKILSIFNPQKEISSQNLKKIEEKEKEIEILNQKIKSLEEKLEKFLEAENKIRREMFEIQKKTQEKQNLISSLSFEINELEKEKIRLETKEEDLLNEIKNESRIKDISSLGEKEIDFKKEEEDAFLIKKLRKEIEMIGGIDESLFKEYEECKQKYDFLSSQIKDLKESISSLEEVKRKLSEKIKNEFFSNFKEINKNFTEYFRFLFKGGRANLVLKKESEDEEIKYGVEIYAKPSGKKIKNIQSLSGGEKALTSLALIFAILKTKKPPFVILDEADAALDELNSLRLGEILKELSKKTQFIIVTHNLVTIETASCLYGVSMDKEGISQIVSLKLDRI
jgi:chromosome segregation protein